MVLKPAIHALGVISALALVNEAAGADAEQGQPDAAASPAAPASIWKANVGVSLIYLRGSARTLTFSGNASATRETPDWIFGVKASGAYGTSRPTGATDSTVVALAAAFQARIDRRFSEKISVYVLGGIETDHVQSLQIREFGEGGLGVIWFDIKEADYSKIFFRTDVGIRYQFDARNQYYPTEMSLPNATLVAPRAGAAFRYAFTKGTIFSEEAEVLPNINGDARVLINSTTKLTTLLFGALSFATSYVVKYDSAPPPSKVQTETALTVGLEVAF